MHNHDEALQTVKQFYKKTNAIDNGMMFNNSVVAGGAIRDTLLGKPIKDIDIFVLTSSWSSAQRLQFSSIINKLAFNCVSDVDYEDANRIVYRNSDDFELPIDIILDKKHTSFKSLVAHFPASISRCMHTPKTNTVYTSKGFDATQKYNKILLSNECSKEYVNRIKHKYPEYETV